MTFTLIPKTKLSKISLIFFAALVILLAYFFLMIKVFNQKGGDTFFSNPNLAVSMILAWACGAASFIIGLASFIKEKAFSLVIIITELITLFTTWFGIAEIAFPH